MLVLFLRILSITAAPCYLVMNVLIYNPAYEAVDLPARIIPRNRELAITSAA